MTSQSSRSLNRDSFGTPPSLEENWDFVTNQFATSCDYLTFTTIVGYIYNYFLHLKPLVTTL